MKTVRKLSLLCLLLFVSLGSVLALPNYTDKFYINDFANIISEDTENYIFSNSKVLDDKTGSQIVVVTVDSLEEREIDDYSLNLFRQWGIGSKDKNNGLLILLAPNERKVKVEIGYGLEGKINDGKAGRFLDDYAVPYFKNDDWDSGIKNLYSALLAEVYEEYGMEVPNDVNIEHKIDLLDDDIKSGIHIIGIIFLLWIIYRFGRNSNGKGNDSTSSSTTYWYGGFGDGGSGFGGGFSGGGGSAGGGGASRGF